MEKVRGVQRSPRTLAGKMPALLVGGAHKPVPSTSTPIRSQLEAMTEMNWKKIRAEALGRISMAAYATRFLRPPNDMDARPLERAYACAISYFPAACIDSVAAMIVRKTSVGQDAGAAWDAPTSIVVECAL